MKYKSYNYNCSCIWTASDIKLIIFFKKGNNIIGLIES